MHTSSMLIFLATVLEQLDLALEHVSKRDVHSARFGLVLTDNAIELILHQIAKDKSTELNGFYHLQENYLHKPALEKALGRSFNDKIKFAKLEGNLNEQIAQTVRIMHGFRNEVYHLGLRHEAILPDMALFYFVIACEYLERYQPRGLGWVSNQKLPERAKKYFNSDFFFPGNIDAFKNGCISLAKACDYNAPEAIEVLADHLDEVISEQEMCLGIVADGVYKGQQTTRNKAVIDTQAWALAFSEKGRAFAAKHGWQGSLLQLPQWLVENYPLSYRKDPIPSWKKQAVKLRSGKNPHAALVHYHSFMTETANLREALAESARQAEAEIDAAIDRIRGK